MTAFKPLFVVVTGDCHGALRAGGREDGGCLTRKQGAVLLSSDSHWLRVCGTSEYRRCDIYYCRASDKDTANAPLRCLFPP
ncbi:hypothetical protein VTO73DRAFT_2772 [Trametes versicolor]